MKQKLQVRTERSVIGKGSRQSCRLKLPNQRYSKTLCSFLQKQEEVGGFLFYVTVFCSWPLLDFCIDFCIMFTLNFLQLKLEDYKDRLKKGEALNQDQLVSLLFMQEWKASKPSDLAGRMGC